MGLVNNLLSMKKVSNDSNNEAASFASAGDNNNNSPSAVLVITRFNVLDTYVDSNDNMSAPLVVAPLYYPKGTVNGTSPLPYYELLRPAYKPAAPINRQEKQIPTTSMEDYNKGTFVQRSIYYSSTYGAREAYGSSQYTPTDQEHLIRVGSISTGYVPLSDKYHGSEVQMIGPV